MVDLYTFVQRRDRYDNSTSLGLRRFRRGAAGKDTGAPSPNPSAVERGKARLEERVEVDEEFRPTGGRPRMKGSKVKTDLTNPRVTQLLG